MSVNTEISPPEVMATSHQKPPVGGGNIFGGFVPAVQSTAYFCWPVGLAAFVFTLFDGITTTSILVALIATASLLYCFRLARSRLSLFEKSIKIDPSLKQTIVDVRNATVDVAIGTALTAHEIKQSVKLSGEQEVIAETVFSSSKETLSAIEDVR